MTLTLYFRLILMSIFQKTVTHNKENYGQKMDYNNQLFYCPRVYAADGFNVSLQIHNGNYCSSNNGYRELGNTMIEIEFGFPSMNEELMFQYSEMWGSYNYDHEGNELPIDENNFDVTDTVGKIPIKVMEEVFEKHGGIDWEKTISEEVFDQVIKN